MRPDAAAYQRIELQTMNPDASSRRFLEEDTKYNPAIKPAPHPKSWRSRFSGYRGGILASICVSTFVLLLNIVLVILSATAWNPKENIATAFRGNCKRARGWVIALHLLINLLSSLLLGASNYTMQRLVAPTRKEIDAAHAKRRWLDIGTPSIRNLSSVRTTRVILWVLLGLSSMPLHFVYNSAVFETIAAHNVDFLIVTEEFFTDKDSWQLRSSDKIVTSNDDSFVNGLQELVLNDKYLDRNLFANLSASECRPRYAAPFITDVGVGFAVPTLKFREMHGLNATDSLYRADSGSGEIRTADLGDDLAYCLSQKIEQRCEVQFSITILLIVIACNIMKVSLMIIVLWRLKYPTIVTVGDAIQSFLQNPDATTENCCLMSRTNVDALWSYPESRLNQRWQQRKGAQFFVACSARRWVSCLSLYIATLAVACSLFIVLDTDDNHIARNGFGRVNVDYIIDINMPFADSIIPYVLLANLPQAVISFIYITYNGLLTSMSAGREWTNYAVKRASLRVTVPRKGQRSTYFLQLPYIWSVPLLVSSVLLHWFISQSIFLARISIYKNGNPVSIIQDRLTRYQHLQSSGAVFSGVGYSDTALLTAIGWGSALIFVIFVLAFVPRYPTGLPIGGTNSAVISAACHLRYEGDTQVRVEEDIADKALMWGVTVPAGTDKIGHCCFSDNEVAKPRLWHLYAGSTSKKDN